MCVTVYYCVYYCVCHCITLLLCVYLVLLYVYHCITVSLYYCACVWYYCVSLCMTACASLCITVCVCVPQDDALATVRSVTSQMKDLDEERERTENRLRVLQKSLGEVEEGKGMCVAVYSQCAAVCSFPWAAQGLGT